MSKAQEDAVLKIIAEQAHMSVYELKPANSLIDDFGFDSLDVIEIVMAIETEFGFDITDAEIDQMQTVGDILALVAAKAGRP